MVKTKMSQNLTKKKIVVLFFEEKIICLIKIILLNPFNLITKMLTFVEQIQLHGNEEE